MPNQFDYINLTYLESISEGNKEIIDELITIFIEQVPEFTEGFTKSFENKEWLKIAAIAHKAKSSVMSMGITDLGDKDLKDLELISKQRLLLDLSEKDILSPSDTVEIEKINKSLSGYEPDRLEWIKNNCNELKIKELIDHFNAICEAAINELKLVLENE